MLTIILNDFLWSPEELIILKKGLLLIFALGAQTINIYNLSQWRSYVLWDLNLLKAKKFVSPWYRNTENSEKQRKKQTFFFANIFIHRNIYIGIKTPVGWGRVLIDCFPSHHPTTTHLRRLPVIYTYTYEYPRCSFSNFFFFLLHFVRLRRGNTKWPGRRRPLHIKAPHTTGFHPHFTSSNLGFSFFYFPNHLTTFSPTGLRPSFYPVRTLPRSVEPSPRTFSWTKPKPLCKTHKTISESSE